MRCIATTILLVACRVAPDPPEPVTWQTPKNLAEGGGIKGPWQQNDSRFDFVDDPSVALAADGTAYVVYADHRDKDIHLLRDGRAAVDVSRSPDTFSWLPRIVVSGSNVYVLWQEIIFSGGSHGGEILFARSLDGGATFEDPQNLSRSIEGDGKARITAEIWHNGSLDLALSDAGTLHAAWTTYDGALFLASSADGRTWSTPRQIAGSAKRPARAPSLALAGETVYLAWTYGEDPRADIHLSRDLGEPYVVAKTPTYSDAPKLAIDRAGTVHLAWAETSGDAFASPRIHYTRSTTGGVTFAPPRTLSRGEGSFPSLAVDGKRVIVVWEAGNGTQRTARGLGLAISVDAGERFTEHPTIPGSRDAKAVNGSDQGRLMKKLAVHGDAIAVVNSARRPNTSSRVWLIRGHLQTSR